MENQEIKVPAWFWVVAVIMLIWNLIGVGSFIQNMMMSEEALQALPQAEQDLYANYPNWTKVAFFVAVFGGAIGSLGLLLRKAWSRSILIVSLVAVIAQMIHSLFIAKAMDVYGPGAAIMPVMIILFGFFLVWFSNFGIRKGWLR